MALDSNKAWAESTAAISANRDVMLSLSGVFFLLPSLAFALLVTQPETPAGITPKQMGAMLEEFYLSAAPYLIAAALIQAAGTLAVLTLFSDRSRPTVGEAIRLGLQGLLAFILSQLLFGLVAGAGLVLFVGAAAASGVAALSALVSLLAIVALVYALLKFSLTAPVVAVDGERNPIAALRRSWELTRGHTMQIALFYLMFGMAALVITLLFVPLIGLLFGLLGGATAADVGKAISSSAIGAVVTLYFTAIRAAVHRQLAAKS